MFLTTWKRARKDWPALPKSWTVTSPRSSGASDLRIASPLVRAVNSICATLPPAKSTP